MTQPGAADDQHANRYQLDVESGAEMVRLLDLDKTTRELMGGLFPETSDVSNIFDVLDIGCGPGGWVLDVAHTYPEMEVTGIDISQSMINYARAHAEVRTLPNAHFRIMNANGPLDFPDASFDLINGRFCVGFIPPESWPHFLAECKRLLRPGGIIRWTEGEWGEVNTPGVETLFALLSTVEHMGGLGFSPTGRNLGIVHMMKRLLHTAGFQDIQTTAYGMDASFGTPLHEGSYQNFKILIATALPLTVKMGLKTQEEVDTLTEQILTEMQSEEFCMVSFSLTALGQKQ